MGEIKRKKKHVGEKKEKKKNRAFVANAQDHQAVLRKLHNLFRYNHVPISLSDTMNSF